jgi:hypothetical protein
LVCRDDFGFAVGGSNAWSGFVHVKYGVPLTWSTNTLSTIIGSVNLWSVSFFNVFVDLVFWLGIMIGIMIFAVAVLLYKFGS